MPPLAHRVFGRPNPPAPASLEGCGRSVSRFQFKTSDFEDPSRRDEGLRLMARTRTLETKRWPEQRASRACVMLARGPLVTACRLLMLAAQLAPRQGT